ncbi:CPCC family cysteine-rich protein [Lysinibacillus sp. LZ02]|uniref:CPCC family cysteine-rich protein n=1 Tax=Lysinibacillus sp. LZ02 TaxID=3420668 RepID=UPI003D364DA4
MKYTCPCCGYKTLTEKPPGTFEICEICEICYWEDDNVQFNHPDVEGGANVPPLKKAQQNYIQFGACDEASIPSVRKVKDPHWKIVM